MPIAFLPRKVFLRFVMLLDRKEKANHADHH